MPPGTDPRPGDPAALAARLAADATAVVRGLAGVEFTPAPGTREQTALGVRFEIGGAFAGTLTMVFEDRLLRRLVIALCARLGAPFDIEDFHDATAELGNLIASGIANRLDTSGIELEISTPGIAVAAASGLAPPGVEVVRLASPAGAMELQWLPMTAQGGTP